MRIYKIDANRPSPEAISEAVGALKSNKIIIYPTETIYGMGGNALVKDVSIAINRAKKKPDNSPLIILVTTENAKEYIADIVRIEPIIEKFWPGPLTILADAVPGSLPANLLGPTGAFAFRMSSGTIVAALLDECGFPITSTSVNITDNEPMKKIIADDKWLNSFCEVALDAGVSKNAIPSTVIDSRNFPKEIKIVRGGAIPAGKLWEEFKGTIVTGG